MKGISPWDKWGVPLLVMIGVALILMLSAPPALAQGGEPIGGAYRTVFGASPRLVVWVIAQLQLMFAAFVLGVPIFAVIAEIIGWRARDDKYDKLAREFTSLLTAAFSTTAAFGGLLAFVLFTLYPQVMGYMVGVFAPTMWVYGLLFFAETFTLYLYYYSWDRLKGRKGLHIGLGILLNLFGTLILMLANSWVTFMMSPRGVDLQTGQFVGTTWEAVRNPLWMPLNIHRFIGNIVFGGFVVAAYAAIRFLGARREEGRAYYDWMGYVGNFIGVAALIPLPFAGYYLGREIYSFSPVMGNNMMGGTFSWPFIIQGMLVGILFIGANFYLWAGMGRIAGSERYMGYIKYINAILIICFAVWLTPHNLPLSPEEQIALRGQFHPVLKFLGLMAAKNAAINFIIISTFISFLLYRRANKKDVVPFSEQGRMAQIVLLVTGAITLIILGWYANILLNLDPATLDLSPERRRFFMPPIYLLALQMLGTIVAVALTFFNRGKLAQVLYILLTVLSAVFVLGPYGFVVMTGANPFLRNIAVVQWLLVFACLLLVTVIDVFLYRGAELVGGIRWGKMPPRSQYTLIGLCITAVVTMGWMGAIRSGLRENWHIFGVMQDTSPWAFTPTVATMMRVVSGIVLVFLLLVSFVFWLSGLAKGVEVEEEGVSGEFAPGAGTAIRGEASTGGGGE